MSTEHFIATQTPLERGISLIEASAGTGKTFAISFIFLRLLVQEGIPLREILVTTYTEAATSELRDRLRTLLSAALRCAEGSAEAEDAMIAEVLAGTEPTLAVARLTDALRDFDQACIHTIHGFCQRVLREQAFDSGLLFDTELLTDESELLLEVVQDYWRAYLANGGLAVGALTSAAEIDLPALTSLLRETLPKPGLQVLGPEPCPPTAELAVSFDALLPRLRACWTAGMETIREILHEKSEWARANKLTEPRAALERVGACLREENPMASEFAALMLLTAPLLRAICKKKFAAPEHEFFELCEEFSALSRLFRTALYTHLLQWTHTELTRRKARRNVHSYNDLLTQLRSALETEAGARLREVLGARFKAALIDEFQDTDPTQEAIFRYVFGNGAHYLFLIGDPKQAIYGFRGADVFTYLQAARGADRRYTLHQNWRSETRLVEGVNALFSGHGQPFVLPEIQMEQVVAAGKVDAEPLTLRGAQEPPLRLWHFEGEKPISKSEAERRLPRMVAQLVTQLLASEAQIGETPLSPRHFAILVAKHKEAAAVQEALIAARIPSVLLSERSVWCTTEARELLLILRAVLTPGRDPLLRAGLATEILGGSVARLTEAESPSVQAQILERFNRYHAIWVERGFIQMFRTLLQEEGVRTRLLRRGNGDRRMTNLLHLAELLQLGSVREGLTPPSLVRWLETRCISEDLPREDEALLRLERDDDAVQVITMHRSKGLEFEIVLCPFIWGGKVGDDTPLALTLHSPDHDGQAVLDLGSAQMERNERLWKRERLAEHMRLFYVAVTRAIHQCHVVCGPYLKRDLCALPWLLADPSVARAFADDPEAAAPAPACPSPAEFAARLESLAAKAPDSIAVAPLTVDRLLPTTPGPARISSPSTPSSARAFRGRINRDWRVTSFSSLTENVHEDVPDHDKPKSVLDPHITGDGPSIHNFPAGARAGRCIHTILQLADFQRPERFEVVARHELQSALYDADLWTPVIVDLLTRVSTLPLREGARLADVPHQSRLPELEFYLAAGRLGVEPLREILGAAGTEYLRFEPCRGWVKGFIDLTFEFGGRYYLLDWKSNRLGDSPEHYDAAAMSAEMDRYAYRLQMHLYCAALHRYLALRLLEYRYEEHFGGAYYIFLRGLDASRPELGVYHERPSPEQMTTFDQWLGDPE